MRSGVGSHASMGFRLWRTGRLAGKLHQSLEPFRMLRAVEFPFAIAVK